AGGIGEDEWGAEPLGEGLREHARGDVARGAGTEADDDAHRPRRVALRLGEPNGERGSAGCELEKSTAWERHGLATPAKQSGSAQYRLLDGLRQCDRAKKRFWMEGITPGFVDDADQAALLGKRIPKQHVDLSFLKRSRKAVIVDAHDKLFRCGPWHGLDFHSRYFILNSLRPITAASYQCTSAR